MLFFLTLKAEALHLADRSSEALEAIEEPEALVERSGRRNWCAENLTGFAVCVSRQWAPTRPKLRLHFAKPKEQKSVSLEKRAEGTYAEYRKQKASGSEGHGFRLPL
jgi:hypothetical protein